MEILSGETICDKEDQIFLDGVPIGFEDITKRRKLGIETIPEERTLHASVPNLKINENTFLTYFPKYNQNKSFIGKILNNPENSLVESEQIIKENDVKMIKNLMELSCVFRIAVRQKDSAKIESLFAELQGLEINKISE